METNYKVYVFLDENNCITSIESSAFHTEDELIEKGYVLVDEGSDGNIYGHAQPNYLRLKYNKPMYDNNMKPNFKYENEEIIALTDEDKTALFQPTQQQPTQLDDIDAMLVDQEYRLTLLELGLYELKGDEDNVI